MTLPEAVIRNRLLAPLCVLFFGIAPSSPQWIAGTRYRPGAGCGVVRCGGVWMWPMDRPDRGRSGRCGGLLRLVALAPGALGGALGSCLGLLLDRADNHDHVSAVLLGRRLDEPEILDVVGEPLEQPEAELGPRLFASPEHDRDLDLVTLLEEPLDVALLS